MQKINVGVIFGGRSVEHEVSIISALQVIHTLDKEKYHVLPIYISKQGQWYRGDNLNQLEHYRDMPSLLASCRRVNFSPHHQEGKLIYESKGGLFKKVEEEKLDVIFPVMHGTHGEDGCLQGLLELSGLPYCGPGVLGSACGMDKIAMKAILKEAALPTPKYTWFYSSQWEDDSAAIVKQVEEALSYPVIVKPACLGSSIGISKAHNREQLEEGIALAVHFSFRVLVEKVVEPLREINLSVLGCPEEMEFSLAEEPFSADEILSFKDKYLEEEGKGMSGARRRIPADIPPEMLAEIKNYAKTAFRALDLYGVCRFDFLLNAESNKIYINEVNTIPGSLSFYLWEPAGKRFADLLDDIIRLALRRHRHKEKMVYSYASNILARSGLKSGKK